MIVIKKLLKTSFLIFLITIILLELFGILLSKFKIIPSGSPAVISLFANKNYSVWHPKNISFKHHYNTCWDPSYVSFNNIGARSTKNYYEEKKKERIGLIGDSMIEMVHVTDGEDLGSLLSQNLKNFEILNFSARSMGLFDQVKIYRNLVRNYKIDHVILFVTENDLDNNYIKNSSIKYPTREMFYVENNKIKIKPIDDKWYKTYNSNINKLKRSKPILLLKNYSNTFKIYFHIKTLLRQKKLIKKNINIDEEKYLELYSEIKKQVKIYKFLMEKFVTDIKSDNVNLYVIMNLRSYLFEDIENNNFEQILRKKHFEELQKLWEPYQPYNFYDEAQEFIKLNKRDIVGNYKYLGHVCDDHYSKYGAKFLSNEIIKLFK